MLANEEEFNNFMHRITEVENIIQKLSSTDTETHNMGMAEADKYLNDSNNTICETIDEEQIQLKITSNKTIINTVKDEPKKNENEMSPDAFMKEVEKDAKARAEDKKIRKEKADTLKVQANKAFKRMEYEKALSCYNKAIDLIKDSCLLYTNRALTYKKLRLYDQAQKDLDLALRVNENSLKPWLILAKIAFIKGDRERSDECIKEAKERHPNDIQIIDEFIETFKDIDEFGEYSS